MVASNSSGTWTASYTLVMGGMATNNGNVSITATDNAGNTRTQADSSNATVDLVAPTAAIVVADTALRVGEISLITITFSEAVSGFTNADLTVANGTLSAVSSGNGGIIWTATLTPAASVTDATNLITLINTGVVDAAGNAGAGTTDSNNYAIDTARPTATIVLANAALASGETSLVTITFNEAITGLTIGDFSVENGSLSGLSSSEGGISWTTTLTPSANVDDATNVITLDNTGVNDAAGNTGLGTSTSNNYVIDSAVPTISSVTVPGSATYIAGEVLSFTLALSEKVTVDATGGIPRIVLGIGGETRYAVYTGGTATSALVFSYTVQTGDNDADGIELTALETNNGTLQDAAGNNLNLALNSVGSTTGVLVDAVVPKLVSLNPLDDATAVAPGANLVVALSEDIALGLGTIAIYDSYDVLFTSIDVTDPNEQLTITDAALTIGLTANLLENASYYVQIASGALTDLAGNAFAGITNPTTWNFTVADITPPVVTGITVSGTPGAGDASMAFAVALDETASNITIDDFTLTATQTAAATIASVSAASGSSVTVTVNGITGTGTLRLDLNGETDITDASGNGNNTNGYVAEFITGSAHTVDRDAPMAPAVPVLDPLSDSGESSSDNRTNDTTPTLTGTAEADATVAIVSSVDGTLGTTTADGSGAWTFTPDTALAEGTHEITLTATDAAGNTSTASAMLEVVIDPTSPAVSSSAPVEAAPTDGDVSFDVVFDDTVYGLATNAFALTTTGTAAGTIASVSAAAGTGVTVTVTAITGTGTLRLDTTGAGITDLVGNLAAAFTAGTAHSVDRDAILVTAGNISVSGATGTAGVYRLGDTITATWNNSISGDNSGSNNGDTATVTIDFSAFGGGAAVSASESAGVWTATYTVVAGGLDTAGLNVAITAVDTTGNVTTVSGSDNASIDNQVPVVSDGAINLSGATGTGDVFKAGDTVTVTWDNTPSGDSNADIVSATVNFTSFGGGAAVVANNSSGSWTASYTPVGALDEDNLNVSVTATDDAGNATTTVDSSNASVDTIKPSGHSVGFDDSVYNVRSAASASFTFAAAEIGAQYTYTISSSGGGTSVAGGGSFTTATDQITAIDLTALNDGTLTLSVVVTDSAGNAASAVTASTTLDATAPGGQSVVFADTTLNAADADNTGFSFSGGEVGATYSYTITSSGGTPVTGNGTLVTAADAVTGLDLSGLADGTLTLSVVITDSAGNTAGAITATATLDQTAPLLSSSVPADGAANAAVDSNLVLTFSEPVLAGSGYLTLFDAADDSVVEAFAVSSVAISGNVLTLDSARDLIPTHNYYLQIASTALVDAAGNVYAGISNATTLNFQVSNSAPVASPDSASVLEDNAVDIRVLTNDTDLDSELNAASVSVVTAPLNGNTSVNTGTGVITYTPKANFNGSDSFTYAVEDVFSALSNVATVTITVTPVNDAPMAVADLANTPEDNAVSIDVAANDTDIDVGDSVDPNSIVIVQAPAHGTAELVNGQVLYTPHLDYNGSDSFSYTIVDQNGATSNVATVIVNVTGVNDLPVAAKDTAIVAEDESVDIDVLANDSDVDGTLQNTRVQVLSNPANGTTSVDALTGVITYTPTANFHGSDTFTYVVQDNDGGTSNQATVTVTVTSVNDAPLANPDTAVLLEDTAHTINVLGNDADIDGALVPASVQVVTAAGEGSTSVNTLAGAIVYTPNENFNGSDSFTYRVQDNEGAWSNPALVTITVDAVNDEPLANDGSATTDEDTEVVIDLLANDSDVDGFLDLGAVVIVAQPSHGSVTDIGDGTVIYSPAANYFGSDSFTYAVADNEGGVSNTATVTLIINPVNDAPLISGSPSAKVYQDSPYSFVPVASDVDPNTALTFSITNLPAWASFDTRTGALTGSPGNGDVGFASGMVISVSDGLLSAALPAFAIEVINVNDPPAISGTPPTSINQDGSYNFMPTAVDVDTGTTLTYSITNLPPWASFDATTGAFTGTPGNSDVATYNNIVISVSDGTTTSMLSSFNITVVNVNDPPIAVADSYSLNEGGLLQPDAASGVLANDSDIDGDKLLAVLVSAPRNASEFTLNETGSFRYLHNGSETRSDSFTYRVTDGTVNSAPVTVSLSVAAVNDAPSFVTTPELSILEGEAYRYDVGVIDPDSVVSLELLEAPTWLALAGNILSGTAPLNTTGALPVVLRAKDGEYTVDQNYNLTVVEQDTSLVSITTTWQGLPALVDNKVDLLITLTHNKGAALVNASLAVSLEGLDAAASMANCTSAASAFTCPVSLTTGASRSFRLRLTPAATGDLIVNLGLTQAQEPVAATITDVSVSAQAVSQGNLSFRLSNATALASINLLNDGSRELVAGTLLGDTMKLLDYDLITGTSSVIGEITNRGYTEQVRVMDIDLDGLDDIVVVNRSGDNSAVYYDRGDTFSPAADSMVLPHAREAILRDLNADGFPELILGGSGFSLYIYESNEGVFDIEPLVFTAPASILHFALLRPQPLDAPMTGRLVIASRDALQLVRFGLDEGSGVNKPAEGDGAGAPVARQQFTVVQQLPIAGVSAVQLVDVDGDGREEIIASTIHQNNSAQASGVTLISVGEDDQLQSVVRLGTASAKGVQVADFDGDGFADLLVANTNNSHQFYRGTGNLGTWALSNTILHHSSSLLLSEDMNNDGLADVLIYVDSEEQVEIYLSAQDGGLGAAADLAVSATTRAVRKDSYHFAYDFTVTNLGGGPAHNLRLVLPLPDGVAVAALPDTCRENKDTEEVLCSLDTLPAGSARIFSLTLVGDGRINNLSLTVDVTSDALEQQTADNSVTTPLAGMFEYKKARIKGGGGAVGLGWLAALLGLALLRRGKGSAAQQAMPPKSQRQTSATGKHWRRRAAVVALPLLSSGIFIGHSPDVKAQSAQYAYVEGSLAAVTSNWNTLHFYYDFAGNTQEGVLTRMDHSRMGWQLLYGYRVHRNVAVELGYVDAGETALEVEAIISDGEALRRLLKARAPISGDGLYLGVRASIFQFGGQELYLKAGLWSWSAGYDLMIGDQYEWVTRHGTNWLIGLGFAAPLSDRLSLGGSIQSTGLDHGRLTLIGVNLQYRFPVRSPL